MAIPGAGGNINDTDWNLGLNYVYNYKTGMFEKPKEEAKGEGKEVKADPNVNADPAKPIFSIFSESEEGVISTTQIKMDRVAQTAFSRAIKKHYPYLRVAFEAGRITLTPAMLPPLPTGPKES